MYPVVHIGPFVFYTFGLVFGAAICLGWFTFMRYFRIHNIVVNEPLLGVILIVSGFLGARLDAVFVNAVIVAHGHFQLRMLVQDIAGGYTYFGCLVAGCLGGWIYAKVNRIPIFKSFDSIFCIGLSYAVGRIGCFLAGDGDYGTASNLPWAMSFPHGILPTTVRVHPTMLYSSAWEFTVFAMLWHLSNPRRRPPLKPGTILGCYLIAAAVGRFLVEFLSRNPVLAFGLKEAQLVSLALFAAGVLILIRITVMSTSSQSDSAVDQYLSASA